MNHSHTRTLHCSAWLVLLNVIPDHWRWGRFGKIGSTWAVQVGSYLLLGPSVVPFYPFFGEGSTTKIDYRKMATDILTSLLEDLEWNHKGLSGFKNYGPYGPGDQGSISLDTYAGNEASFGLRPFDGCGRVFRGWLVPEEKVDSRACE